jgi:hypothetical protein
MTKQVSEQAIKESSIVGSGTIFGPCRFFEQFEIVPNIEKETSGCLAFFQNQHSSSYTVLLGLLFGTIGTTQYCNGTKTVNDRRLIPSSGATQENHIDASAASPMEEGDGSETVAALPTEPRKRVRIAHQHDMVVTNEYDMTEAERDDTWWRQEEFDNTKAAVKRMCRRLRNKRRFSNSLSDAYQVACTMQNRSVSKCPPSNGSSSSIVVAGDSFLRNKSNTPVASDDVNIGEDKQRGTCEMEFPLHPVSAILQLYGLYIPSFVDLPIATGYKACVLESYGRLFLTVLVSLLCRDSRICSMITDHEGWNDSPPHTMPFEGVAICMR